MPAPSAAAFTKIQVWQAVDKLNLPVPSGPQLNQRASHKLAESQRDACLSGPVAIDQGQRALFDHLAALLQQRPQSDLAPFALGPISGLPTHCRHLLLLTGRVGGNSPGWLAAGRVSVPDGDLLQLLVSRWPAMPQVSEADVLALTSELIMRINEPTR